MSNVAKIFDITINLSDLYNYFDISTKLFLDLYLANCLDTPAKPFFVYGKSLILLIIELWIASISCRRKFA